MCFYGFRLRERARCWIKSRMRYVKPTLLVAPCLWESHGVLNQMIWTPMTAFQRPGLRGCATKPIQCFSLLISLSSRFLFFPSCPCNVIASVRWNSVNTGRGNATDGVTVRRGSTLLPFKEIHGESRAYNNFPGCSECFHYYFSHFVSPNEQYGQELCNLLYKY